VTVGRPRRSISGRVAHEKIFFIPWSADLDAWTIPDSMVEFPGFSRFDFSREGGDDETNEMGDYPGGSGVDHERLREGEGS
jgi:hypothetical protein